MSKINQECPLAAYNTVKKELMGIFRNPIMAGRYLFTESTEGGRRVSYSFRTKYKMNTTIFEHPVAIRRANEKQLIVLNDLDYVIMPGYPEANAHKMAGFVDNKYSFRESSIKRWN